MARRHSEIPIKDAYIPNLNIQVDLVGESPSYGRSGRSAARGRSASGLRQRFSQLSIPPLLRTLNVQVIRVTLPWSPGARRPFTWPSKMPMGNR